uniref:Uncharacterized protein n=1 Tax=Arundo donax TaxID=35708 RepID=A0A0A9FUQ7_ARUDO
MLCSVRRQFLLLTHIMWMVCPLQIQNCTSEGSRLAIDAGKPHCCYYGHYSSF